ncbi:MAG TPA: hypothetical protein VJ770_25505 [Stellaceae bacterium]|nr:hypothetical protein [Stellaceae bacterium]
MTPAALGVDDWVMRRRFTYGTVLVDLEHRRPVALLLSLSKGRSRGGHACGGAPGAVQVADRFHLLQNLTEALELAFTAQVRELREIEQARRRAAAAEGIPVRPDPPPPPKRPRTRAIARREQHLTMHETSLAISASAIRPRIATSRAKPWRLRDSAALAHQSRARSHWNAGS